ncbi:MAG: HD domain-containing protein [Anaerolineales bacterium]
MKTKENPFDAKIHVPTSRNELLAQTLDAINNNQEITTLWHVINVNAMDRMGITDHGPVHFQIAANIALKLCRLLIKNDIPMSITVDYQLSTDHAEVVVLLASILHDLGMSINRTQHEEFSLFLTNTLLRETLDFLPTIERTIVIAETLHAIISHRSDGRPLTLEAGIVRVADALDMSKGRSRIPYEAGEVNIHSVSAAAIDNIEIEEGEKKPIQINILMNNSAGLFQVDELLKNKILGSGLEPYIDVNAYIDRKKEKNLLKTFSIKGL